MRFVPLTLLGLFAIGCSHTNDQMSRFYEDGRAKPTVAIASMLDTTSFDLPWSLSEELTSMVTEKIGQSGKIFVGTKLDETYTENPFGQNLDWVKREFPDHQFVVFLELVEHEVAPANPNKKGLSPLEVSKNLNMAVRMRVIDLRSSPKIVLQEIVRDAYFIPKTLVPTNYNEVVWGSNDFLRSPMGIAHTQLVQDVASRISDYILLAKSR